MASKLTRWLSIVGRALSTGGYSLLTPEPKQTDDVERCWREFWFPLLAKDGVVDIAAVKVELYDYWTLLEEVPKVYDHITAGAVSKPNTLASIVIAEHDERCWLRNDNEDDVVTYSRDEPVAKMVNGVVVETEDDAYWRARRAEEQAEAMREEDELADPSILEGY